MLSVLSLLFAIVGYGLASTIPPPGCVHNGKTYHSGASFQPTPCELCFCSADGRAVCAIADCFFTPCVDSVHDPTKCCPVCPNGQNCKHQDGTIIKKYDVYRPDANTVCKCPVLFHYAASMAICDVKAIDPVQPQVVS